MTAREFFERMKKGYACLQSYGDQGEVTAELTGSSGRSVRRAEFRTRFERPLRFRMDYFEGPPEPPDHPWPRTSFAIARDGGYESVFSHGEVSSESADLALARFAGVSNMVSYLIPPYLLSLVDIEIRLRRRFRDRLDEDPIGGFPCHRLTRQEEDRTESWWIDADTGLVRKFRGHTRFSDTVSTREMAEQELRLKAAGIPDDQRPRHLWARPRDPFTSETVVTFRPRVNPTFDRSIFRLGRKPKILLSDP